MTTAEMMIVVVVAAFAGIVKAITGTGYPLILLPVLALMIDVGEAVVLIAPSNLYLNAKNGFTVRHERRNAHTLPRFLAGGFVGTVLGSLALPILSETVLRIVLIVIVALFLINRLLNPTVQLSRQRAEKFAPVVGGVAGLFQGATGLGGPIATPWFLSVGLSRDAYLYSVSITFILTVFAQVVLLAVQGLFTWTLLALGLALIPLAVLVFPLGLKIRQHVSVEVFERLVLVLLAVSIVLLLIRVL